jgi:hypothetical protein
MPSGPSWTPPPPPSSTIRIKKVQQEEPEETEYETKILYINTNDDKLTKDRISL